MLSLSFIFGTSSDGPAPELLWTLSKLCSKLNFFILIDILTASPSVSGKLTAKTRVCARSANSWTSASQCCFLNFWTTRLRRWDASSYQGRYTRRWIPKFKFLNLTTMSLALKEWLSCLKAWQSTRYSASWVWPTAASIRRQLRHCLKFLFTLDRLWKKWTWVATCSVERGCAKFLWAHQ